MPEIDFSPAACVRLLPALTELLAQAALAILRLPPEALSPELKHDSSPVTAADKSSETIILAGLQKLLPSFPVVSEECAVPSALGRSFVLVDPLDGTREFLAGRDEYTINLGLVQDGRAVAGLMAAPAQGLIWRGVVGHGAERLPLTMHKGTPAVGAAVGIRSRAMQEPPTATVSRSHPDPASQAFLSRWQNVASISCGSALKFCRLAEGAADVYPRLTPTSEWDIAAGDALLAAAGGILVSPEGKPIAYGGPDCRVPGFIAWGDAAAAARFG
jgi:3'(2'), 5'-bisphosphate nucleotidase